MDVIVCVKRVPDTETRVRFSDGATVIEPEGVKYIVSDAFEVLPRLTAEIAALREAG